MKWSLLPAFLLFALLGLVPVSADDKPDDRKKQTPKARLPLGQDTTYVVGPLDKDGFIDYEAALNAELSRGITPDQNANVLLIQSFGPAPEGGEGFPPVFFKWLDIPPPPRNGDYFYSLGKYARDRLGSPTISSNALYDFQSRSIQHPWSAKDYTPLAEWLKINEKPTGAGRRGLEAAGVLQPALLAPQGGRPEQPDRRSAAQRAEVSRTGFRLHLPGHASRSREANTMPPGRTSSPATAWAALTSRRDAHRIAGWHRHRPDRRNSTLAYLNTSRLTSKQALGQAEGPASPPSRSPDGRQDRCGERLMGLDSLQLIRRGGTDGGFLFGELSGSNNKPTEEDSKIMATIDWTPTMQTMNKWYDRMAAAMR